MSVTLTYGGLDLNDGTTYTLLEGLDPGEYVKTYSEYRSYTGAVAQYNVTEANLVEMRVPLLVRAASLAALRAAIGAINAKIDAGAQDLVFNDGSGEITYVCLQSPRVEFEETSVALTRYWTQIEMTLYRGSVAPEGPPPAEGGWAI